MDARQEREREIAWQRFLPATGSTAIAPLLICPDDLDYWCSVLVVEVIAETQFIHWNRVGFGWDNSLTDEIGTTVRWLSGIGPFTFCRTEYERCLEDFRPVFYGGEPYWQETEIDAIVYKSKAHLDFDPVAVGAVRSPHSGLYCFPRGIDPDWALEKRFPLETRIALRKKIGKNRSHTRLRHAAQEVLPLTSVTAEFLLRDYRYEDVDKHSIPVAIIPELRQELEVLRNHAQKKTDQELLAFVQDMEALVDTALRENNPIIG
jgi:hypothetical protein